MKEIKSYEAAKYAKGGILSVFKKPAYQKCEEGIYKYKDDGEILYVTSLSFVQEPEFEEGTFADDISQYPLEDILDKFYCHISDFYENLNVANEKTCYLEFAAESIDDIRKLRSIIGKHVYNKSVEEDGKSYIRLMIE